MRGRHALLSVIAAVLVVGVSSSWADNVPKSEVLMMQQAVYFQKIKSLDFTSTQTTTVCEARRIQQGDTGKLSSSKLRFRYKEGRFVSEINPTKWQPSNKKATIAYDGVDYQFLGDGELVKGANKLAGVPYGTSLPPFDIFAFLLMPADDLSLQTFGDSEKWLALAKRISSVTDCIWSGHKGCMVAFDKPATVWPGADKDQHEVFLCEEFGYLPLYWKTVADSSLGRTVIESAVTKSKQIHIGDESVWVPVAIRTTEHLDGALQEENTISVASITINGAVDDKAFRLPDSAAGAAK